MTNSKGLVKASVVAELTQLVERDEMHILDACNKLNVPYAYILCNISDPKIKHLYRLSKDRTANTTAIALPQDFTPSAARDHTLKTVFAVGAVEKYAHMIAAADPETEEGQKLLIKLQPLLMKLIPSASEVTTEEKKTKTAEEIEAELEQLRLSQEGEECLDS